MISKKQRLKRELDRLIQQIYVPLNPECLVCCNHTSCMHHYIPKAQSLFLRWNERNLIPLCVGCHFSHHSKGDPYVHQIILLRKGHSWANDLQRDRRIIVNDTIGNLVEVKERLESL